MIKPPLSRLVTALPPLRLCSLLPPPPAGLACVLGGLTPCGSAQSPESVVPSFVWWLTCLRDIGGYDKYCRPLNNYRFLNAALSLFVYQGRISYLSHNDDSRLLFGNIIAFGWSSWFKVTNVLHSCGATLCRPLRRAVGLPATRWCYALPPAKAGCWLACYALVLRSAAR